MASWMDRTSDLRRTLGLLVLVAIPVIAFAQNPFSLSEKDEVELGRLAAGEIEKDILLVQDPVVVKYIGDLGQSLVQKSTRKEITYTFKIVNSPEINAFALPGGFVYVNRGLIEAAETQDELAGVLAHEIGHVVARHGADQAMRAGLVQTGLGALGGLLGRGASSTIGKTAAEMVATGVFMKFSRQAEREADRLGARMLYDASLQPRGMVSFFEKLSSLQKSQPNAVLKFFSSHPSPAERSSNVSTLIAGYPTNSKVVADTPAFRDVKKQLAGLPRPEVEAAKAAAAIAAVARPPAEPEAEVRLPEYGPRPRHRGPLRACVPPGPGTRAALRLHHQLRLRRRLARRQQLEQCRGSPLPVEGLRLLRRV